MSDRPTALMTRLRGSRLLWRLYFSFLVVIVGPLAVVGYFTATLLADVYRQQTAADLIHQTRLFIELSSPRIRFDDPATLRTLCPLHTGSDSARFTLVAASGEVWCDTEHAAATMNNHASRPEIAAALRGTTGMASRHSDTLGQDHLYVAEPIRDEAGIIRAVLRTSMPVRTIVGAIHALYREVLLAALAVMLLAAGISYLFARRLNHPITLMRDGARRFAEGELEHRIDVQGADELNALAASLNTMAGELHARIDELTEQRNELEAFLASMTEAVLVVEASGRIKRVNEAARRLLAGDDHRVLEGQRFNDVCSHKDLLALVEDVLAGRRTIERELTFADGEQRDLSAQGAIITDAAGGVLGVLVVLNDVTRLKRLERIRRDFVANVSHELKTPITSIQGFVETLKDGAIDDPEKAHSFLEIIRRQAGRLNAIIEDLLALSRLEQEAPDRSLMHRESSMVAPLLESALLGVQVKAEARDIVIEMECPTGLSFRFNPALLEQAVINLLDNAVKYGGEHTRAFLTARLENDWLLISVSDQGPGIASEHQSRIFERFYRVDKARSRKLGGTGLGLAIVKHIVQIHRGKITVESTVGVGSTFTIHLPPV